MKHPDLSKLNLVEAIVFDIDGVLTDGSVLVTESGEHLRSFNIKDGYAIQYAAKKGLNIIVISGGSSEGVRIRLNRLGVKEVHLGITDKLSVFNEVCNRLNISKGQVLYMGDDIPDFEVMQECLLKTCPSDAVWQIKEICDYISPFAGGKGAARDIIEKVLSLKGQWV